MNDFDNRAIHAVNQSGGWVLILLLVVAAIATGAGYTWGEDNAIARLTEKQREVARREKSLQVDASAAFSDGWTEGRGSIQCIGGFAVDRRTGKPLQVAEVGR